MENWLYNDAPLLEVPDKCHGFVYKITNIITDRIYIGRKYFWQIRKVKNKKRRVRSESNWRKYYGSSKLLLDEIQFYGKENFRREIMSIHETAGQVNFTETKQQFIHDVLYATNENGDLSFYNQNILGRYITPIKLAEAQAERNNDCRLEWSSLSHEDRETIIYEKCLKYSS